MVSQPKGTKAMKIYVFSNGSWLYEWEINAFLLEHDVGALEGGREIDLDKLWTYPDLSNNEIDAVSAALGD